MYPNLTYVSQKLNSSIIPSLSIFRSHEHAGVSSRDINFRKLFRHHRRRLEERGYAVFTYSYLNSNGHVHIYIYTHLLKISLCSETGIKCRQNAYQKKFDAYCQRQY